MIKLDFYRDWINHLIDELQTAGYAVNSSEDPLRIAIKYFNVRKRDISDVPRKVYFSKELTDFLNGAQGAQWKVAVQEIKEAAEAGRDLTPFLSKRLLDADYNDHLLNDWRIHHFHLSTEMGTDGFVKRTGPLLFAMVLEDAILMINIFEHGAWTNSNLIQILHNNWPEFMEQFKIRGIPAETVQYTSEMRKKLRNGHVNVFVTVDDGTVYGPIGGGITTAGSATDLTMLHDMHAEIFRGYERYICQNIEMFRDEAEKRGRPFGPEIDFKMELQDGVIYAVEQNTKLVFKLGILEDQLERLRG